MSIEIQKWNPDDCVSEITQLLHLAYKELADLGFKYVATWQDDEITRSRLESGIPFIAKSRQTIIGTATLYLKARKTSCDWYKRDDVAYFGQFAVHPDFQRDGVGTLLMDAIEAEALKHNSPNLALDTAREASHLVKLYERRGFEFAQEVDWEQTNYTSIIMNKKIGC